MQINMCEAQDRVHEEMIDGMGHMSKDRLKEVIYAGVFEEAGEIAGIHKRQHRMFENDIRKVSEEHLMEEIGDLLWYTIALCCVENLNLQEVFEYNRKKLEERYGQH